MLDIAKTIVEYWRERSSIVAIEETNKIYIYDCGLYILFTDARIKNWINIYLDDLTDQEKNNDDWVSVKFTTTLLYQVKNRLFGHLLNLKDFDKFEWRVNCRNGLIDLRDGSFMPHYDFDTTPYKSFQQIPIEYNKEALCPTINNFLIDVFGADRIAFIYEIIGYILYKSVRLQKSFIFFGEPGCGKTTFFDMLKIFLGQENWTDVSIYNLNKPFQKANLKDKLANIHDELPVKKLDYIENYKEAVTNFYLTGGMKFVQGSVTWRNFCKQLNSCNKLPIMDVDTGYDFWRRIILIHCTNYIDSSKRDIHILEKITDPQELSGLLNCCIFHVGHLLRRGCFLSRFDDIEKVKGIWQINVNPLKLFLDERCSFNETNSEESDFFRAQVNAFRKEKNALPISMNMITRKLKDLGIEKKQRGNGRRYYIGIKINTTIIGDEMDILDTYFKEKKEIVLDTFGKEINFDKFIKE